MNNVNNRSSDNTESMLAQQGKSNQEALLKTGQAVMKSTEDGLGKAGDAVKKGSSMSIDEKAQARGIEDLKGAPKSAGGIQAGGAASQAEVKPS